MIQSPTGNKRRIATADHHISATAACILNLRENLEAYSEFRTGDDRDCMARLFVQMHIFCASHLGRLVWQKGPIIA